jgi:NADPH-dependent 2,4-dienoyl-CoA reductase/sulfur reductase-like enzyme
MGIDETVEFCRMLENKVDLIHVTSGIYHSHVETKAFSSMFEPHGCNLDLAYAVKKGTSIPVVSVGGFNSPDQAEAAISEGKCDFVALGRQQFADPEFVNKARAGLEGEIAPCLRCSCFNPLPPDPDSRALPQLWHCSVNPTAGRELRWRTAPTPQISRKVLIAGGGPSGLYAAATAAARGHKVILCEKSDKLGGVLWFADHDPHKESLMRYRDSLIRRCERLGVEIRVGVPVTAALVISINPDKTICACGAEPATPRIPGIEHARYALSAYSNPDLIGTRVLMIGGGLVGCETALHLAQKGHQVHLVELRNDIALDANDSHRRALIPLMSKCVTWECGVSVSRIESLDSPDALNPYLVFYSNSKSQDSQNFDTVLYATGLKPLTDLALELQAENIDFVSIGDCSSPRQVKQAVYEGFCAAMDIL